jgi:hypothetical protein
MTDENAGYTRIRISRTLEKVLQALIRRCVVLYAKYPFLRKRNQCFAKGTAPPARWQPADRFHETNRHARGDRRFRAP